MIENILKLIEILVWPITIIAVGLLFRKEVRVIISRISKLKYKDFELSIEKELSKIETIDNEKPSENPINSVVRENYYETYNRLLEIAKVSSRAAISEAWRELEHSTIRLLEKHGYDTKNVLLSKVFRNILHENNYPTSLYTDFKRLREIRNKAIHAEDFEISETEAEKYIITALDLFLFIEKLSDESNN